MPSPSSFAIFAIVNAIVWPGFALAYWYKYQREEERLMDAENSNPPGGEDSQTNSTDAQTKQTDPGGEY